MANTKDWSKITGEEDSIEGIDAADAPQDAATDASVEQEPTLSESEIKLLEHPGYKELEKKLTLAEQKAQENWDKTLRAVADAENAKRRSQIDVGNAHKYALEKFATELLPVLDSLEQAMQASDADEDASHREGLELTYKMFTDALAKFNITQIDPIGQMFDPKLHEAMTMQDDPNAEPNSVIAVFQKGYVLNERVIRPARVVVARGKPKSIDEKA